MPDSESPKLLELCRHKFRIDDAFMPCPFCKPEEAAALRGQAVTEEDRKAVIVKSKAMRNNDPQNQASRRALQLEGQTLAGCFAIRVAAAATGNTRFLWRMSCDHEEIRDGTELRTAEKANQILKCKACAKAESRAQKTSRARARNTRKGVT